MGVVQLALMMQEALKEGATAVVRTAAAVLSPTYA
jgi:hypothetical protein